MLSILFWGVVITCLIIFFKSKGSSGSKSSNYTYNVPSSSNAEELKARVEAQERQIRQSIEGRHRCIKEKYEEIERLEAVYKETNNVSHKFKIEQAHEEIARLQREISHLYSEL